MCSLNYNRCARTCRCDPRARDRRPDRPG